MAKMKVHELAKELGMQSKELIALLANHNIVVTSHSSAIEDDAISVARNAVNGKNSKEVATKAEATTKVETPAKEATKAPAEPAKQAPVANASENGADKTQEAPKKKKIIFVGGGNANNNKQNRPQQGSYDNRRSNGNGYQNGNNQNNNYQNGNNRTTVQQPHKLIRPTQKPIPVTEEPYAVRQKAQQEKREAERREQRRLQEAAQNGVTANEKANVGETRENKEVVQTRPQNETRRENQQNQNFGRNNGGQDRGQGQRDGYNNNSRSQNGGYNNNNRNQQGQRGDGKSFDGQRKNGEKFGQGDRKNNGGFQNGNRGFNNNERGQRPGQGQDNRFKRSNSVESVAPETTGKDTERRRNNFAKENDKRSKKDHIYEDDNQINVKKAGRFIKPEKKVEEPEEQIKVISIPETITLKDLADKMKMQPSVIIKKLFLQGQILTVNSEISFEEAENIAIEYEIMCEKEEKVDVIEELLKEDEEAEETLVKRPPVVCVMGHVDHGKTSLLDAIRKTNVTDKEAGGITQAIGAYTVNINGEQITFLDTPGHEAFTAMRMRGANATDIAVLVVAADDGVMPQTEEAINHAKAAGVEIIVAVNKIDKPSANIERVKQEMTEHELIPVDWGGSTEFVPVSAKSGEGIEDLLETILLTSEILELKANPDRNARGLVIEAELDKGRGPVATVLVQKGTLHVGDFISAGACHGKVRAMIDDKGRRVKEATPSTPVEILGLSDVPAAGEVFIVHENDKSAKNFAETYMAQHKEEMLAETKQRMSLEQLFNQIQEGNLKELNLIVKADVQGSVEAVKQSLTKLSNEEVIVKCIHGGVGAINESDVTLASASNAIIIGFNVRPDATAKATAEREGVDVRLYSVIYQAIEDVEAAMKGMLDPVFEEKIIGHAEVRQIFKASAVGNIAGSYILDGEFQRNCKVRITREGEQIYEGQLASLKRFKDDVKEVKAGFECGLVFDGFDKMQELDIVEAYIMVEVPR